MVCNIDIRVIVIGIGSGVNSNYYNCLLQDSDDFIALADYTDDDFDSITGVLSSITCPFDLQFKMTEIAYQKKMNGVIDVIHF